MRVARAQLAFTGIYQTFLYQFKRSFMDLINDKWGFMWDR